MRTLRILSSAREALDDHALAARTTARIAANAEDTVTETLSEVRRAAGLWSAAGIAWAFAGLAAFVFIARELVSE